MQVHPIHDAVGTSNMAAAMSLSLERSLLRMPFGKRGLLSTYNLDPVGKSMLLFSRCLFYASKSPKDQGRKIMVAGLRDGEHDIERSKKSLERYFKSFGQVVRTQIIRDHLTGRSKGYGFVTFKNSRVVGKILSSSTHVIDGNGVKVSLALKTVTKSGEISVVKDSNSTEKEERKLFVSGLKTGVHGTTDNDLKEYFSAFGEVEEARIVTSKTYGFVTFKTPESVKEVLSKRLHSIAGWKINVDQPLRREDKNEITRRVKRTVSVYNVSPDTSDDELVGHFLRFGEVEKIHGRDSNNKHSYQCMVVFKTELSADMATGEPVQELATGGKLYVTPILNNNISKTILLRDTPANITLEVLQLYFEQFGKISCMDLTSDHYRSTHVNIHGVMFRTRPGLPTIEFQDEHTVENVLQSAHVVCGKKLELQEVDIRAMDSDTHSQESDRSMMVLIDHLPRSVSKKTVADYFATQSLSVQSVEFKMEQAQTMSCVVGFWNLDDVDQIINQVAPNNGVVSIDSATVLVRRLHWESTQERGEPDIHVNTEDSYLFKE